MLSRILTKGFPSILNLLPTTSFAAAVQSQRFSSNSSENNNTAIMTLHEEIASMIQAAESKGDNQSQMLPNSDLLSKPWEASCLEIQTEKFCKRRKHNESEQQLREGQEAEEKSILDDDDEPNTKSFIILYYETHTREGLMAFRSVATRVCEKSLPGEVENRSAFGFAMWKLPAEDFLKLSSGVKLSQ